MEFKEDGVITVDRVKKKKVKCYKFHCKPLGRYLMVHQDIDNPDYVALSDFSSGYRFLKLPKRADGNKLEQEVKEKLEKFIKHFTSEGINEEIARLLEKEKAQGKK